MDKNFFLLYNEIVYHIHTCEDMDDLKRSILAQVKLPIGGIMSEEPYEDLLRDVETAKEAAHSMGCPLTQPFFTMSQTVLSSLPELGFTDKGIVDVKTGAIVDVLVHEEV